MRTNETNPPRSLLLLVSAMLVLAVIAAACGSADTVDTGDNGARPTTPDTDDRDDASGDTRPTLKGIWVLQSFDLDGTPVALPDGTIDLEIELGRISGTGGCNSFGGMIDSAADGSLTISEMAWTEMACVDGSRMDFESSYLPALAGATRWEASPDGITFASDTASMTYTPGEPPTTLPFEGTTWTFDTIFSGEGIERTASTTDMSKSEVTAVIAEGSLTLTSDDCGTVVIALNYEDGVDGNLAIPDPLDKPTCADEASNMVAAIDGFWEASGFMVNETRLTLIGLPGELIGFRGEV